MLAALQAEPAPAPVVPPCDQRNPDVLPCTEPPQTVYLPADAIHLRQLADLGGDSIRVSLTPSLGGLAELYQVTTDPSGRAELLAVWFVGHPYSGWREIGREETVVNMRDYRRLAARVDAELGRPDDPLDGTICMDGSGMRTERHTSGRTARYESWGCGDEASGRVFSLVSAFACREVGRTAALASIRNLCQAQLRAARDRD